MDKEIIYKRSRKDIAIYLILSIIGDLGAIYAIQVNSLIVGLIGLIAFGCYTIYLIVRLISPDVLLQVNKKGIKTKYTKGEYLSWNDISEIYIDNDEYKDRSIKFPKVKYKVRGDYNVNLQYSNGNLEVAYNEIKEFYKNNIK